MSPRAFSLPPGIPWRQAIPGAHDCTCRSRSESYRFARMSVWYAVCLAGFSCSSLRSYCCYCRCCCCVSTAISISFETSRSSAVPCCSQLVPRFEGWYKDAVEALPDLPEGQIWVPTCGPGPLCCSSCYIWLDPVLFSLLAAVLHIQGANFSCWQRSTPAIP